MKKLLTLFSFVIVCTVAQAQSTYRLLGDTIRMYSMGTNGSALLLENVTRYRSGAFLRNISAGRTDFAYAIDTTRISNDTLFFHRGDGWYAIKLPAGSGGGSGTVTSISVTTANGVSGTVANSTTTPAISLSLGAITPTSVAASGAVTGSNLAVSNWNTAFGWGNHAGIYVPLTRTVNFLGNSYALTGNISLPTPTLQQIVNQGRSISGVLDDLMIGFNQTAVGQVGSIYIGDQEITYNSGTGSVPYSSYGKSNIVFAYDGTGNKQLTFPRTGNDKDTVATRYDLRQNSAGGTGTVTTLSVTTANGVSGTVTNPTTTPAISLSLGDITPSKVTTVGDVEVTDYTKGIILKTSDGTRARITLKKDGGGNLYLEISDPL